MPLTIKTGAMKVKDPSTGNYVDVDMSLGVDYAPLNSPAFAGTPTAPTPTSTDDSNKIATTAFVQDHVDVLEAADSALQDSINAITPLDTAPTNGSTKGITSDAVYDAIATLSAITIDTLQSTRTETATTFTLDNNRKFSDYKYVAVALYAVISGDYFQLQNLYTIPLPLFISFSSAYACVINTYIQARIYGTFRYISDTTVSLSISNGTNYAIGIYGIK